ncbi:hypothetical protein MTBBW1_1940024 [Desulfamplus magnetovallimortis]|uniref:Uncharacterized protein n=1 Tax=Desulfamplus magnetovallimortis TaxID=1246637 RepID=A0A1W1HB40_9BACT|nr:XRE family transcriptional regulator [Desulfamplus magnetovallimortis]SLM29697.1 hypothetical protein MTBBW1_1940024 [Desulfamplus magnetovallimortis]
MPIIQVKISHCAFNINIMNYIPIEFLKVVQVIFFADLGVENAEELQARGLVGLHVVKLLKKKERIQEEAPELLRIKQAEV